MAKRYSRTLVAHTSARDWLYKQRVNGSDHADLAGNCQRPVFRPLTGMKDTRLDKLVKQRAAMNDNANDPISLVNYDIAPGWGWVDGAPPTKPPHPYHVDLAVRCRKCAACLKARAYHWRKRAESETKAACRTWFGTLTLGPEGQFKAISRARSYLAAQGLDFDLLSPSDQFAERHRQISPDITRYFKRVRKQSGASFKYLLVAEAHKSGAPHYHVLLHERADPVRAAILKAQWRLGFCNWKLVQDVRMAGYVCKYLAKSSLARVRASQHYGESDAVSAVGATLAVRTKRRSTF